MPQPCPTDLRKSVLRAKPSAGPDGGGPTRLLQAVNVVSHIDLRYGGICSTTPPFARALRQTGRWQVQTIALAGAGEVSPFAESDGELIRMPEGGGRWLTDGSLKQALRERVAAADVVHVHGLWEPHCAFACAAARVAGKPYMVSAHGMLDSWALGNKRWKKVLWSALVERRNLARAACLRAVTPAEIDDYRRYGMAGSQYAVLAHGVDVPQEISPRLFLSRYPNLASRPVAVFLGRLHYKKGLDVLCRAWSLVLNRFPDARLVLAGPESPDTQANLRHWISELDIGHSVIFTGMVAGALKWSVLAAATLFVLPSYSENFAVAISEALAAGIPAIVSRHCNRPEVAEWRAGWVIDAAAGPLAESLELGFSMSPAARAEMGENGRRLVQARYSWEAIGRDTAATYDWLLGLGPAPACVSGEGLTGADRLG